VQGFFLERPHPDHLHRGNAAVSGASGEFKLS
jgi:hypothetical protein